MSAKKIQLKHVALILFVGVALILGYYGLRSLDVRQLNKDLHELRQKITLEQLAEVDFLEKQKHLEGSYDLVAFVEELYAGAQRAGLDNHDVTTSQAGISNRGRNSRRGNNVQGAGLKTSRLQVELRGSFRQIAEYLKAVEASQAYKQITHFEMAPDDGLIKMTLMIDLYQQQEEGRA